MPSNSSAADRPRTVVLPGREITDTPAAQPVPNKFLEIEPLVVAAVDTKVRAGEDAKSFVFFAVGVEGANYDILQQIAQRNRPLHLRGLRFRDMFRWLSNSLSRVSHSTPGDRVEIEPPVTPYGWASIE